MKIPDPQTDPIVLTVSEAARTLACGRGTVLRLIESGRLRALRLGARNYRIPRQALDELLAEARDRDDLPA